ncbi:MAG: sigma-54-dependent Fis family transcriptional regulator [bacterium]|nr:sigma-54-dependent Fis family transcriptional regulator [bacterium]
MSGLLGKRILVVDDEIDNIEILTILLEHEQCEVVAAMNGPEALDKVKTTFFAVIILDIRMPGMDGIQVLEKLKEESPQSLVIILTAYGSKENVQKACKLGVYDMLDKPVNNKILMLTIQKAFQYADSLVQSEQAGKKVLEKYPYENIIGTSANLRAVFKTIEKVAPRDTCVAITGETGTGKELVARAIHARSKRRGLFIAVNVGALPENLLETELFGHEKGAFTDAKSRKFGFFESCKDGTIFLDEIGDISPRMQVSLLRVLQEKKIIRVGDTRPIEVNARVITATNKDLEKLVANKTFREDLYYRIKTITLRLPALRERPEDIPHLVSHFIKKFSNRSIAVLPEVMEVLLEYNFPGNVRELEHIIERALIFQEGDVIRMDDLPPEVTNRRNIAELSEIFNLPWKEAKLQVEKLYIENMLSKTAGNVTHASERSGIDRSYLQKQIKKYDIKK